MTAASDPRPDIAAAAASMAEVASSIEGARGCVAGLAKLADHARDALAKAETALLAAGSALSPPSAPTPAPPPAKPPDGKGWPAANGIVPRSGLGWLSGITPMSGVGAVAMLDQAERLRGCKVDSMVLFQGGSNRPWKGFADCYTRGHHFQIGEETAAVVARGMVPILTIPGIVRGSTWEDAAAGKFDGFHKAAAANMAEQIKAAGKRPPVIILRPSRESDDEGQPFGAERDKANGYRNFMKFHAESFTRIWTDALGPLTGKVLVTFCLTKRGHRGLGAWDWGADIVDCDLYINSPPLTKAEDTRAYDKFFDPFYDYAAKRNRPLAFSEWGIRIGGGDDEGRGSGGGQDFSANDSPAGVTWMRRLFERLAAEGKLVHENYYNPSGHGIVPPTIEAKVASAAYASLWKR